MKNILVTGGAGFIGSNLVHTLLRNEPEAQVVNLDALTYASTRQSISDLDDHPRHVFVEGNICDRALVDRVIDEYAIDTIVHLAAESHVDRSISGPKAFIETNITGTFVLLEAARARGTRFHHVSTDEVYGSLASDDPSFAETTAYAPSSPYSASKAASDHLVRAYHRTYGLPVTISNCSNNYGPYQFPEKLIPLVIQNAMHGAPLPVYGDGAQVRDWLYVSDHCEAICAILDRGRIGETYNIGGDNQPTNLEIVKQLCALLDERFPESPLTPREELIEFVKDRPGHDRRYAMDISKIKAELGWAPKITLAEGLRDTVDWYLANDDWLRSVAARPGYQEWIRSHYAKPGENR